MSSELRQPSVTAYGVWFRISRASFTQLNKNYHAEEYWNQKPDFAFAVFKIEQSCIPMVHESWRQSTRGHANHIGHGPHRMRRSVYLPRLYIPGLSARSMLLTGVTGLMACWCWLTRPRNMVQSSESTFSPNGAILETMPMRLSWNFVEWMEVKYFPAWLLEDQCNSFVLVLKSNS